jgi:hypothetical protein
MTSILTVDDEMIYGLHILLTHAASIYKSKTLPSKIINWEDFAQICCPIKECDWGGGVGVVGDIANTFPGELTSLSSRLNVIVALRFKALIACWGPQHSICLPWMGFQGI